MGQPENAYLYVVRSTDPPGAIWRKVKLTHEITPIGRPERGQPGLNLAAPWVSRQHAQIVRRQTGAETTYTLEHTLGRAGTRLYARLLLQPGDSALLRHSYTFQIPGVFSAPGDPHFRLTLAIGRATICPAIEICQPPYIKIFCQAVKFEQQEFDLLRYLYQHRQQLCLYANLLDALWPADAAAARKQAFPDQDHTKVDRFAVLKKRLEPLVNHVRKKIRQASGGVDLIETINGEGLCLW